MNATCENCADLAEQNHALQQRAIADHDRIDALVNTVTEKDHKISALKGELTKLRTDSPKMADAEEVFRFWQSRLKKRPTTTFGPERQKKVLARLKEKSLTPDGNRKDDLKWAVVGCAEVPFVGPQGRQPKGGQGAKLYDDLTLICRDETTVERFMGYADDRALHIFRRFVSVLEQWVGAGAVDVVTDTDGGPIMFCSACPVCAKDWALQGYPGQAWAGELLVLQCQSGCKPDEVRGTLRGAMSPVGVAA